MARTVDEIMNRQMFEVPASERADRTLGYLLGLGITSAPVLDDERRPIGVVSLRDLAEAPTEARVKDRMSSPAFTFASSMTVEQAALQMAQAALHHAPVVDRDGRAVGVLSALDVLRAIAGLPAQHPAALARHDAATGLTWSEDTVLAIEHAEVAPNGPGVLTLIHGGVGLPERVVWVEGSHNLRARVIDLVTDGGAKAPQLAFWLERRQLRFRCAAAPDPALRERALAFAIEEMRRPHPADAPARKGS